MKRLLTHDIGFAIADFLIGQNVSRFEKLEDDWFEHANFAEVVDVDAGDPNNPVITLDNDQRFTVRVIAHG